MDRSSSSFIRGFLRSVFFERSTLFRGSVRQQNEKDNGRPLAHRSYCAFFCSLRGTGLTVQNVVEGGWETHVLHFFRVPLSLLFALPPVLVEGCGNPGAKEEEEGREEKGRERSNEICPCERARLSPLFYFPSPPFRRALGTSLRSYVWRYLRNWGNANKEAQTGGHLRSSRM